MMGGHLPHTTSTRQQQHQTQHDDDDGADDSVLPIYASCRQGKGLDAAREDQQTTAEGLCANSRAGVSTQMVSHGPHHHRDNKQNSLKRASKTRDSTTHVAGCFLLVCPSWHCVVGYDDVDAMPHLHRGQQKHTAASHQQQLS